MFYETQYLSLLLSHYIIYHFSFACICNLLLISVLACVM
jgi:hypothetical protein